MRGYDDERDEYEDYYDDEGQEYEEEDGEEYEEEEEPPKPSKEELEYLELRQKLKESIRKQMKKEGSGSSTSRSDSTDRRKNKLPYDNYGSFFGPSQPVIAQRVIQESKSLLENQHLASRISNPHHIKKSHDKVSNGGPKSTSHNPPPPKVNEMKVKAQKLKDTRDYSFLFSNDITSKAPQPKNIPIRNSEARPAQFPARSKQPLSNGGKLVRVGYEERRLGSGHEERRLGSGHEERRLGSGHEERRLGSGHKERRLGSGHEERRLGSGHEERRLGSGHEERRLGSGHEERRLGSAVGRLPPKTGTNYKTNTISKSSVASTDSRKQPSSNGVNGPGRPVLPKGLPSKLSVGAAGSKSSTPGMKNPVNGMQKSLPSKAHSSIPRQNVEQRKDGREINKPKMIPKQPVASSKPQINKPLKPSSMHNASQDHRRKPKVARRPFDEEEDEMDISNMIRSMFNYNPKKFVDDDDDDNMEAGFDEIMREERRSAKIAKKEDEEQLRLIEEEEERERRRRMSKLKKRKLGE